MVIHLVRIISVAVAVLFALADINSGAGAEERGDKQTIARVDVEVQASVEQLGSDNFAARERATRDLVKAGKRAIPAVKAAAFHNDAEVSSRAIRILEALVDPSNPATAMAAKAALIAIAKSKHKPAASWASGALRNIKLRPIRSLTALGAVAEHPGSDDERKDPTITFDTKHVLIPEKWKGGDEGLVHLTALKNLESLSLHSGDVTDDGLIHLKTLTGLRQLIFQGTQITDAGLVHLKTLTNLNIFFLLGTRVTGEGLAHLKGLTEINYIDFGGSPIGDEGLLHLKRFVKLEHLILSGCNITDLGLVHLKQMVALQDLQLNKTRVTGAGLKHLERLDRLHFLVLSETPTTDANLVHLKQLAGLQYLLLEKTNITNEGLKHLAKLTALKKLWVHQTRVTSQAAKNLQEALPNCKVFR